MKGGRQPPLSRLITHRSDRFGVLGRQIVQGVDFVYTLDPSHAQPESRLFRGSSFFGNPNGTLSIMVNVSSEQPGKMVQP